MSVIMQSEHAQMRYAQRVLGIVIEEKALEYVRQNRDKVFYLLAMMLKNSELIVDGYYQQDKGTQIDYYLYNNRTFILVNPDAGLIVTLYHLDIAAEEVFKRAKRMKKIKDNMYQTKYKKTVQDQKTRIIEDRVKYLEEQLAEARVIFEEECNKGVELHSTLKELKLERTTLLNEMKISRFSKEKVSV